MGSNKIIMEDKICLATRSTFNEVGKPVNLRVNYFDIKHNPNQKAYRYSLDFEPEIASDAVRDRRHIYKKALSSLEEFIGANVFNNLVIYGTKMVSELIEVVVSTKQKEYKVTVKLIGEISKGDNDYVIYKKKIFSQSFGAINLTPCRKTFLDLSRSVLVANNSIKLIPSYSYTIDDLTNGMLSMKIDASYKMFRNDTVFDFIKSIRGNPSPQEIRELLKGSVVYTAYNNSKSYCIDDVNFDKTPLSTFECKGEQMSFQEYYSKKYDAKISNPDQPLLVSRDKKNGEEIYLVPELCYCTGLTDDMRGNFNLMKEINGITKGSASQKIEECRSLLKMFKQIDKAAKILQDWGVDIVDEPKDFEGKVLSGGEYVLSNNYNVSVDDPKLDRNIQREMFDSVGLNKWAILYGNRDDQAFNVFCENLQGAAKEFNFPLGPPNAVKVNGNRIQDWEAAIKSNLDPTYQIIIFIIPGKFGKGALYKDLKTLTLTECPIPTQVILTGTLLKPKGVRSVVNKILVQMNCKLGGTPWGISDMPFSDQPTMVVGLSKFSQGNRRIIGFAASLNAIYSQFFSNFYDEAEKNVKLIETTKEALDTFKERHGVYPSKIIFISDGFGPSQAKSILKEEVVALKKLLNEFKEKIALSFFTITTKSSFKFVGFDSTGYKIPVQGTLIDKEVISNDVNDFYLISAKANQGIPSATHYTIVYEDEPSSASRAHSFVYKLCFLYYNWVGAVKVPSPCQLAKKLVILLGEKIKDSKVIPAKSLKSLYYL